jgi:hypothetical protein
MEDFEEIEESVDESPLHSTRFQPGQSGNPAGRPKGSGKAKSRMRTTLKKLYDIEGDAVELLRQSMTGKDKNGNPVSAPPKDKVDMAKFVVKAIESYNNTCLREEMAIIGIRDKGNESGADELARNQSTEPANASGTFSMDLETNEGDNK